jgi:ATP-dependent Clp protease ATP-binding subunit ClpA
MFTPEFRNRLDADGPFARLTPEVMHRVVDKFVGELETQLTERQVTIVGPTRRAPGWPRRATTSSTARGRSAA